MPTANRLLKEAEAFVDYLLETDNEMVRDAFGILNIRAKLSININRPMIYTDPNRDTSLLGFIGYSLEHLIGPQKEQVRRINQDLMCVRRDSLLLTMH